jgi:outer membrane lipoprotein SlyB
MSQEEKPKDENHHVVIALFADRAVAESAMEGIKDYDRINDYFELGTIGTISKEGDKIKTQVDRKTGKGATIGAVVGVIGAVLTGGASLLVTAVGAGALGGALGSFFKKSMHLTQEEIAQIGQELDGGRVAVVVTCDDFEIPLVTEFMVSSKGTVRTYSVPQEAVAEAAGAPEVMDAVGEAA